MIVGDRVELNLFTTLKCNLACTYCTEADGGSLGTQGDVTYSIADLKKFVATHARKKEVVVTFYGGEPTLNPGFIDEVIEALPLARFQLQTNGTLMDNVSREALGKLSNILISVDGGELATDIYRGDGVYQQVTEAIESIRPMVDGTITARMTWSGSNIDVGDFLELTSTFDYVYWQFVQAQGFYSPEQVKQKKAVLEELVNLFFTSEKFLPLIPLMGIVRNKLFPHRALETVNGETQCRAATHLLNITPDGSIYPCPDLTHDQSLRCGDITTNTLGENMMKSTDDMPCRKCEAFSYCRQNCLKNLHVAYTQKNILFRTNITEPICDLVRYLGRAVDKHDLEAWYARQSPSVKRDILQCPIYEYVEVMP